MTRVVVALLKLYRLVVSPLTGQAWLNGQTCRYYPSCSAYALGSVQTHGALRGVWLAIRRLGRCHPWCAGGVDLVPTPENYRWWGLAAGTDGEDEPADASLAAPAAARWRRVGDIDADARVPYTRELRGPGASDRSDDLLGA